MVPEKPNSKIDLSDNIQTLLEAVKKFVIQKELKYLTALHDVPTYKPEIQKDLANDVQGLLEKTFERIETEIDNSIEDAIGDFEFDFESALSDNHDVHSRDTALNDENVDFICESGI